MLIECSAGDDTAPARPEFVRVCWERSRDCSLDDAAAHLEGCGLDFTVHEGHIELADLEGNPQRLLPYAPPASRLVAHARKSDSTHPMPVGHPQWRGSWSVASCSMSQYSSTKHCSSTMRT